MKSNPISDVEDLFERMSSELPVKPNRPHVDLVEHADEYVLRADLPGFDREEIDVTLRDRTLTISADREEEAGTADAHFVRRERRHRAVTRSIKVPESVDPEDVTATYQRGVLEVRLPRPEADDTHTIDVD